MTNATKAAIILVLNAVLGVVTSFGASLTDKQQAAITGLVNALLGLWVLLTYKNSAKRLPDQAG